MFSVQVGNSKKNSPQISDFYGNLFSLQIGKQQYVETDKLISSYRN